MSKLSERLRGTAATLEGAMGTRQARTDLLAAADEIDQLERGYGAQTWMSLRFQRDEALERVASLRAERDAALGSADALADELREIAALLGDCTNDQTVGAAGDAWIKALDALAVFDAARNPKARRE